MLALRRSVWLKRADSAAHPAAPASLRSSINILDNQYSGATIDGLFPLGYIRLAVGPYRISLDTALARYHPRELTTPGSEITPPIPAIRFPLQNRI